MCSVQYIQKIVGKYVQALEFSALDATRMIKDISHSFDLVTFFIDKTSLQPQTNLRFFPCLVLHPPSPNHASLI